MNIDLKTILQKLHIPKRAEYRTISAKAHHDWKLITILSALLIIIVVLYNVSLFSKVTHDETTTPTSARTLSREAVSQKTLQDTIDYYKAKSEKLSELKTSRPNTYDPSL